MALRKIYIVVDCVDDTERNDVQNVFNEVSNARLLKGGDIINMLPVFNRNKDDLLQLFRMIKDGGIKSLMSIKGGSLIAKLSRK